MRTVHDLKVETKIQFSNGVRFQGKIDACVYDVCGITKDLMIVPENYTYEIITDISRQFDSNSFCPIFSVYKKNRASTVLKCESEGYRDYVLASHLSKGTPSAKKREREKATNMLNTKHRLKYNSRFKILGH